jgi:prophage DNA circulation protein
MPMPFEAWRASLRPASFRGAGFKVDINTRNGGRRTTLHQFPKRDDPESEDMGRQARRFTISGYVVGPDFLAQRDALILALEAEGAGQLVHPTMGEFQVNPGEYSSVERRERGRVVEFEMVFFEAGNQVGTSGLDDTQAAVNTAATAAEANVSTTLDAQLGQGGIGHQ